jgi:ribosomal protein L37AE/L43A
VCVCVRSVEVEMKKMWLWLVVMEVCEMCGLKSGVGRRIDGDWFCRVCVLSESEGLEG